MDRLFHFFFNFPLRLRETSYRITWRNRVQVRVGLLGGRYEKVASGIRLILEYSFYTICGGFSIYELFRRVRAASYHAFA